MKFLVLALFVCAANAATFSTYNPNFGSSKYQSPVVSAKAVAYSAVPDVPYVQKEYVPSVVKSNVVSTNPELISEKNEFTPEGFDYTYVANDGTGVRSIGTYKTVGADKFLVIRGGYKYVTEDGQQFYVTYVADENGYQPKSPFLPTPPPVPELIARSLDYIASQPKYEEPIKKY